MNLKPSKAPCNGKLLHHLTRGISSITPRSWRTPHCKLKHYYRPTRIRLTMSTYRAVPSAVILPESEQSPSPPPTLKRRQSSLSDDRSKRARLGHDDTYTSRQDTITPPQSATLDRRPPERQRSGQLEERKRGQRLFGALLGTLSQSSSSTAQKRRTDIEKRQQAKLKLQAEEQDEKKKLKLEALLVVRRREQKKFDKQSVHPPLQKGKSECQVMLTSQ